MNYLARLKMHDSGKNSLYLPEMEPTKPTEPPFDGFVGSIPGANENISWCWWLAFSETEHLIAYFHPEANRAEVLKRYPRVFVAEPYDPPRQTADAGLLAAIDLEWEMT